MEELKIEYVDINSIKPYKKNAKTYGYTFTQKGVKIGDEWKN